MMRQYHEAKQAAPDALLLFRMGDFYELFHEDAQEAAGTLQLTLTSRDKGDNATPMAGFPHHQLENYLGKLIAAGYRVAICDQVESPREAKGIVKREITRVVTPGTINDDALLDPRASNFLVAIAEDGPSRSTKANGRATPKSTAVSPEERLLGLSWVDLSTGQFQAAVVTSAQFADELARLDAAECLLSEDSPLVKIAGETHAATHTWASALQGLLQTLRPPGSFSVRTAKGNLGKFFGVANFEGLGFNEGDDLALAAAGAILEYLQQTQKSQLAHLDRPQQYRITEHLEIDAATRRNLEIHATLRDSRREGSLLGVLDTTVSAMGARRLSTWLQQPLRDRERIEARHDAVAEFVSESDLLDKLRELLDGVHDLPRLLARVTSGRARPRDLSHIASTLARLPAIKARLSSRRCMLLQGLENGLDLCADIRARLETALLEDCPLVSTEGGMIRPGFDETLDGLRELASGGKQWIAAYQNQETERTGIPSLKIGFNKVFGYYLEVTNAHKEKVPSEYIRKQTLKNAERYITPELKEYEERVLSADEKAKDLELRLFLELRDLVVENTRRLQQSANVLADLDVLAAFANVARRRRYCQPRMIETPGLQIVDGRHPVLDATLASGDFVPNDLMLDETSGRMLLITGPNMAGKSTYIRQAALLTLMAQIGSFVPAASAEIGIADRVFARVGASDELARGQSTFMVEMTETARILNTATERSLVILDEIGRGTSTYDGLSLAWAVVEHIQAQVGCRTLFATHYHELTDLARELSGVRNANVAVREWNEEVIFLHKIVTGPADKSYGIHVARLAGIPRDVVERAKDVLSTLEEQHLAEVDGDLFATARAAKPDTAKQLSLFGQAEHPLLEEIRRLETEKLTPLDALNAIENWRRTLRAET